MHWYSHNCAYGIGGVLGIGVTTGFLEAGCLMLLFSRCIFVTSIESALKMVEKVRLNNICVEWER